jgi:hypothetical protein
MKRLVYTVTFGETHERVGELTHPLIADYAWRHGADFKVVGQSDRIYPDAHPNYEDFQIPNWLEAYDEIVHLDTDLIVANDTPWLLTQSGGMMCATDESFSETRNKHLINYAAKNGKPIHTDMKGRVDWPVRYFNVGVFGVTAKDKALWTDPDGFWDDDGMGHQTFTNYRIITGKHPVRDLGPDFNALVCLSMIPSPNHQSVYIIHYAGMRDQAWLLDRVKDDINKLAECGRYL